MGDGLTVASGPMSVYAGFSIPGRTSVALCPLEPSAYGMNHNGVERERRVSLSERERQKETRDRERIRERRERRGERRGERL